MKFLESEFEGTPSELNQAVLAQLEQSIRSARQLSTSDRQGYELACIAICAQLKASLDLLSRIRSQISDRT